MRQLFGAAEQPLDKSQRLAERLQTIIGFGQRMWQAFFQQPNPSAPVQKRPERSRSGVRAELLVGELDLNGLVGALELNLGRHRLVSRVCAR